MEKWVGCSDSFLMANFMNFDAASSNTSLFFMLVSYLMCLTCSLVVVELLFFKIPLISLLFFLLLIRFSAVTLFLRLAKSGLGLPFPHRHTCDFNGLSNEFKKISFELNMIGSAQASKRDIAFALHEKSKARYSLHFQPKNKTYPFQQN